MQNLILPLVFFVISGNIMAQQTMREVTNTTSIAEDNKPNSDSVPNGYAINGQFERIMILNTRPIS